MKYTLLVFLIGFLSMAATAQTAQTDTVHSGSQTFAEMVKALENPSRFWWQKPENVMNLIRPLKGRTVMDLGCGTGYFSFLLADSGANVIAADVDERFIAYVDSVRNARGLSKRQIQTRKVPADDPMLSKREVDMVFMVNTYHLLQDRVNYLKKVKAGLKQSGFILIIDFFKKDLPVGPAAAQKLSADEIIRDLKLAGFSQFKTDDKTLPYQYIVFAL